MPLPHPIDVAALRSLDQQCAVPDSVVSRRTVAQLAVMSPEYKQACMISSTERLLENLDRCALEAGVSPDTTASDSAPVLVIAAQKGAGSALKALVVSGANIELADRGGGAAFGWAARGGHLACVQLLLDAGRTQMLTTDVATLR